MEEETLKIINKIRELMEEENALNFDKAVSLISAINNQQIKEKKQDIKIDGKKVGS